MNHIVIAGGSGFLGRALANYFTAQQKQVVILTRNPGKGSSFVKEVYWDGKTMGNWALELERAEALINLSGKSVNCRYTERNRKEIYSSRLDTTCILGEAVRRCMVPPTVWLNTSSATIYRDSYTKLMDEYTGDVGNNFSEDVCQQWESAFKNEIRPRTRKVVLRTAIVLSTRGGALVPLLRLVRIGFGGHQGSGNQFVSWLHIRDFCRIVDWLTQHAVLGVYNVCAPQPMPNHHFMETLRGAAKVPVGLPLPVPMLALGARLICTETELLLKSRKVYPQRLLDEEFVFEFPDLKAALEDLCQVEAKRS